MEAQLATKAEFAALIKVSPGRVSQYISEGKLGQNELEGTGRSAKVRVPQALAALKLRLDSGQMLGNGLGTKLQAPTPEKQDAPKSAEDELDLRFKLAKLQEQEGRNRKLAEEERARAGIYVRADDVRAEMAKITNQLLQQFEGGLADIASAIAAQYNLPQRDLVHMMRSQFRELRGKVSGQMKTEGLEAPAALENADTQH